MIAKVTYMCGSVLSDYHGTGNDKDEKHLKRIFVQENISCSSKIELPYYSVDFNQKICIDCGVKGTGRTLGNSVEHYPKCDACKEKPDINHRKSKALTENGLSKKKKK